jgi:LacI family xylobiose transport system transcriptional regulator
MSGETVSSHQPRGRRDERDGALSRTTLARVAKEASVSISTVSKVLNGRSGVADATRSRIEELLQDHEYNPRRSTQAPSLIEVVFSELDSPWAIEILRGVGRIARESALSVVVTESGDRHSPGPEWIDGVILRQPAGVILMISDLPKEARQQLLTRNIPFVVVDPAGDPAPDVPSIGSANWNGGLIATKYLLGLGHRKIGMITGPTDMNGARARVSGYLSALDAAGIAPNSDYLVPGNFHPEDGVRGGRQLLTLPDRPTAIFAGSDLQAFGVYEAARSLGIRIPEDLSVVGYDDVQIARWAGPPLTTVRQPLTEMAEEAARMVLRMRSGDVIDNLRIDLATSLVIRESALRYEG